jgi:hypothetical protein
LRTSANLKGELAMPTPEMSTAMKILAAVLDFLTIFMAGGFVVARLWGLSTDGGFKLKGTPALVLFAVVIAYFWLLPKITGSTLWHWILGPRS